MTPDAKLEMRARALCSECLKHHRYPELSPDSLTGLGDPFWKLWLATARKQLAA